MPRCYMTGVEIKLEEALILDRKEAYLALKEIRVRLKALERLVSELGQPERVEKKDRKTGQVFLRTDFRMLCPSVAEAFSSIWPEKQLFMRWSTWKSQRKNRVGDIREREPLAEEGQLGSSNGS